MQSPTTIIKNYTDEVFKYIIETQNGLVIRDEIHPNSHIDFMNVGVGDKLTLDSDNYLCKYIFNHGANPKYFITYPENKIKDMFGNRGYNPIVVTRKDDKSAFSVSTTNPTTKLDPLSSDFNTKLFIGFICLLVLFIASLIAIIYLLTRKKYTGGNIEIPIKEIANEPIYI